VNSPLLETSIEGARGILLNITGGADLTLFEVNEAAQLISDAADDEANIIFGAVVDERLEGSMSITVVATGFGESAARRETPPLEPTRHERPSRLERDTTLEAPAFDAGDLDIPSFVRQPEEGQPE
jgi:cell division protein FtsZ